MRYRVLGFVVETDLVLDLDPIWEPTAPDYRFQILDREQIHSAVHFPFHTFKQDDGTLRQSWSKSDHGYKLHYFDLATFWLSADGRLIRCLPNLQTPLNTLQHLLLDQVLPYAVSLHEQTVLHAGAIVIDERAVIFLGEAGQGKSTLTASICAAGFPLLADDSLLLRPDDEQVWAVGSYPGLRLWSDSQDAVAPSQQWTRVSHYNAKRRIMPARQWLAFCADPVPIANIYVLDKGENPENEVRIETLAPNERFVHLMRHSFRLDITDRQRTEREFQLLTRLATRLPIYRLRYPRRYDCLPQVRQALINHLETANASNEIDTN